jgi:hypothetical protein
MGGQEEQAGQAGQGNLPIQPNFNTVNQLQQQRAAAGQQLAAIDQRMGHELGNVANFLPIQQEQMFLAMIDAINRLTNAVNNLSTNVQTSMLATYVSSFVIFLFVSYIDIIS